MAACNRKTTLVVLFLLSIFLHVSFEQAEMRPLGDEQLMWKQQGLVLQSLQKGGPANSSPNPCSYVPGRGTGTCTLNGMNVAGSVVRSPPAFPGLVVDVGVASATANRSQHDHQHQSSLASI
ncbi:hypothetical protein K2173_013735 [Erythroxylum novogranatense]|uniref:Uncharacterized protein n=1 Tax=Erythroxylum novogranatense TaxID=1862640 RepID=A0AAV8SAD7_9ROSI|nr:hypothetical protein K2173_013735 [Erythroxylum novogranatense]